VDLTVDDDATNIGADEAELGCAPRPVFATAPRPATFGQAFHVVFMVAVHVGAIAAIARGPTRGLVLLALATYLARMFAVTAGYHRYFSHRAFRTSRLFQLALAFLGTTATQKGPLWWASTHRAHHRWSDTEKDVHSPARKGVWYAHAGWWLGRAHEQARLELVPDFAGYPELRWLDRNHVVGPAALIAALFLTGGVDAVLWGYALSTCLVAHATFSVNSVAHLFGWRRYATRDTSRNNPLVALVTLGEGWHNNHHHYMSSANQGFFWWELDVTYAALRVLDKVGLVWALRRPPARMLRKDLVAEVGERSPDLLARASKRPPAPASSLVESPP
jgi:stearoyl-CoA desaturase (delta-9 desaturase)